MSFSSKKFRSNKQQEAFNQTIRGKYMKNVKNNSFIYFGLPFMMMLLGATYMLSEFTQLRYEKHDRKVTAVSEDEALSIAKGRRKIDLKDEFYRLQQMDIDNWEQQRVKRLPGESENKW